jgi:outer membrane protein assembly complex protein YaeT
MRHALVLFTGTVALAFEVAAQTAVDIARPEQRQKAQRAVIKEQERRAKHTSIVEFRGEQAFKDKELRTALKEEITTVEDFGLSAARADDLAFFLEVFYRKHGYAKVDVHYVIESQNRLRLDINEGPRLLLRTVIFDGNTQEPTDKLFDYMVGPTRERYSQLEKRLPFVAADMEEGTRLVQRFYVAEGFLNAVVDPPGYKFLEQGNDVDVVVPIHEGQQYFFGRISFTGQTIYGSNALRGQIADLLQRPYTDARVDDIPRRLEAYFKARGYYDVNVDANASPDEAVGGRVPVEIAVSTGPVYYFDGVTVSGLQRLHPSFVSKRFTKLKGKTYSPDVLDERFRTLMKTSLFNILQIKPVPVDGHLLRLDISAEEAKSKEFGFWVGFDTYEGALAGVQVGDRDLFGTGRAGSAMIEISQRSYRGDLLYEDPFFLDTDFVFKARASAFTFEYDGYTKFELGGRFELSRKVTKYDEVALVLNLRRVDITDSQIRPDFLLGPKTYLVNTIGLTNKLDFRESPYVNPRGWLVNNTVDVATKALGSDIEFVRGTMGVGYYLPFGPKPLTPGVAEAEQTTGTPLQRWFRQSSIAFGARAGIIHSLTTNGAEEATALPIDERFFNGGATTVRSFGERDLGPHDNHGHPVGGEFFTVFNVEYTFPIFGELQGAVFTDAGNLLPTSEDIGLNDMRYAIGAGLRYKLPVGPIRLDYGINPDPRPDEDFGAFHFSFGFAF